MPRPGGLPPSQALTVAPTSANSPSSWIRPAALRPCDVGEQQRVLARVVGRRRRRVAAVVGGEDQQVAVAQRVEQVGQPAVEVLQAAVEVDRVVAVAPEHVGLDEVHEDQALVELAQQLLGLLDAVDVRLRRVRLVDVAARRRCRRSCRRRGRSCRRRGRASGSSAASARARSRGGSASARSCPGSPTNGRAITRPTACLPVRISRAIAAALVELLERDRLLVRRDLEDRVGRRVDDPLARALVLLAELLDDLRPRGRLVAEHAAAGAVHERVDHVVREARADRSGTAVARDDAHQLPVAGRRVLALRALEQPARRPPARPAAAGSPRAARRCRARAPRGSAGRGRRRPARRCRACRSPRRRSRRRPAALPRRRRPARSRRRAARGYSRAAMDVVLGLLGLLVFIACVIALAAGDDLARRAASARAQEEAPSPQTGRERQDVLERRGTRGRAPRRPPRT